MLSDPVKRPWKHVGQSGHPRPDPVRRTAAPESTMRIMDKKVAKAYGAFSPRLGVKRAVIVIDEQGVVRHRHDHMLGLDYQSVDELKAVLDTVPVAAV